MHISTTYFLTVIQAEQSDAFTGSTPKIIFLAVFHLHTLIDGS